MACFNEQYYIDTSKEYRVLKSKFGDLAAPIAVAWSNSKGTQEYTIPSLSEARSMIEKGMGNITSKTVMNLTANMSLSVENFAASTKGILSSIGDNKFIAINNGVNAYRFARRIANRFPDNFKEINGVFEYSPIDSDAVTADDIGYVAYMDNSDLFENASNESLYASEFANRLSSQLGVQYQTITEEQAIELTEGTSNPWNGEKAFFLNGEVFFVGDALDTTTVVHEFAHPLVRAVAEGNRALFDNLYKSLKSTEEGAAIIRRVEAKYPELPIDSDLFKEEVIVTSIALSAANYNSSETKFNSVIKDFFFAIKKMLREIFGKKIAIEKLSPNTSVEELANMLMSGEQFSIDVDLVRDSDVVAYARSSANAVDSIMKVDNKDLMAAINSLYGTASVTAKALKTNEFSVLRAQLGNQNFATAIQEQLGKYQTIGATKLDISEIGLEESKDRIISFMSSVKSLSALMSEIKESVKELADDYNNPDSLQQFFHYKKIVDSNASAIEKVLEVLLAADVSSKDPIMEALNEAKNGIDYIDRAAKKIYKAGAMEMLNKQLAPMAKRIDERYERILANYKKKSKPSQSIIDKTYKEWVGMSEKEYNRFKELEGKDVLSYKEKNELAALKRVKLNGYQIDSNKVDEMLSGNFGDAHHLNSMLEGYMYNNDLIVGGLANYIQTETAKAMNNMHAKLNSYAAEFEPLAKAAGYNPNNIGELGRQVWFLDTVGEVDENGEYVEKKVYSYIDKFKNYRFAIGQANFNVRIANESFIESGDAKSEAELMQAVSERDEILKWFHREYTDEYYDTRNSLSAEARTALDANYNKRRKAMSKIMSEQSYIDSQKELDAIDFEYKQLFSLTYPDGSYKPKGSNELALAEELIEYRNRTRDLYEDWRLDEKMFENAYNEYSQYVVLSMNIAYGSAEYKEKMNDWTKANTRIKNTDSFYLMRDSLINNLTTLLNEIEGNADKRTEIDELYKEVFAITSQYRGSDGVVSGIAMPKEAISKLKELQEKINEASEQISSIEGLTKKEVKEYFALLAEKDLMDDAKDRLSYLESKKKGSVEHTVLNKIIEALTAMSTRQPTEEYVDIVNEQLANANKSSITEASAYTLLDPKVIDSILEQNAEFKDWWHQNHTLKEVYNARKMKTEERYERIAAWNVTVPSESKYIETHTITDSEGNTVVLNGVPKLRFYNRAVKEQYRTKQIVGETVNNKGEWLPKDVENSPFINEKYNAMAKENPALFALMESLKKKHLEDQEFSSDADKLYLDAPRFLKGNKEAILEKDAQELARGAKDHFSFHIKRAKEFFRGSKEDAERGFNYEDTVNFIEAEYFDTDDRKLVVYGLYNLDAEDVSMDVLSGMARYSMSLEKKRQYKQIMPWVRSVQEVVDDPQNAVKDFKNDSAKTFLNRINIRFNKRDKSVRSSAINNMIERDLEGQSMRDFGKDWKGVNNVANFMFKSASFSFFAMNIPSALKNSIGAMFQGAIESAAGQHFSPAQLARGSVYATKAMMELSFGGQLQTRGSKSLTQQTIDFFDFAKDRAEKDFGEHLSRNTKTEALSSSFMMSPRRWLELNSTISIGSAMLYKEKVNVLNDDGTTTQLPLIDAFEIVDNRIQTKKGVDKEWSISYDEDGKQTVGEKLLNKRKEIHQVLNNLQGAYAKLDQPEAQRYILYRFIMFIKRFFTPMAIANRFGIAKGGKDRYNIGLDDIRTGYYADTVRLFIKMLKTKGEYATYIKKEEVANLKRVLAEQMGLFSIGLILLGLGWDDDDADRENFKRMEANSGALPSLFTSDKKSKDFDPMGYALNHAIYLAYSVRAENEQLVPTIRGAKHYKEIMSMESASIKPTIGAYLKVLENALYMMTGNSKGYYSRDSGPYIWQEKGSAKITNDFVKIFGLNGYSISPTQGLRGLKSAENIK